MKSLSVKFGVVIIGVSVLLTMAMLLGGCGHTSDTQKALEAGKRAERGSWVRPDSTVQQTWIDYSLCGSGILYTKEGFSQKDYENDLSMCIQAEIDTERHIRNTYWIPIYGTIAQFTTLSVERCMNAKGYKKLDKDAVKSASAEETTECMKAKGYDWKAMTRGEQITKPQATPSSSSTTTVVTVTWTSANIRSGAGDEFSVLTTVNRGERLTIIGERGEWFNIRLEDGTEGWIKSRAVK